jgi:hypothetical protein
MDTAVHRVFVVGDSLFAETVAELLGHSPAVAVVGVAADVNAALAQLAAGPPDATPDVVIVLTSGDGREPDLYPLLAAYPDLPILRADLNANMLRLIRSERVEARAADLMAAIQALPTRR